MSWIPVHLAVYPPKQYILSVHLAVHFKSQYNKYKSVHQYKSGHPVMPLLNSMNIKWLYLPSIRMNFLQQKYREGKRTLSISFDGIWSVMFLFPIYPASFEIVSSLTTNGSSENPSSKSMRTSLFSLYSSNFFKNAVITCNRRNRSINQKI